MLTRQNKPDRDAEFCKATDYNDFSNNEQINRNESLRTLTHTALQTTKLNVSDLKRIKTNCYPKQIRFWNINCRKSPQKILATQTAWYKDGNGEPERI